MYFIWQCSSHFQIPINDFNIFSSNNFFIVTFLLNCFLFFLQSDIKVEASETKVVGRFTFVESCSLLELVMAQQKTNNFHTIDNKKIDFKNIALQLGRFELTR